MISRINIYADSMNPESGGIQNTAYELLHYMVKEYEVYGLSSTLPAKYKDNRITEIRNLTRLKTTKWLMQHSNRNTCNIVMNCWMGIPALLVRIIRGSHYFVLAHGNDVYEFTHGQRSVKRNLWLYINLLVLQKADFIACNSEYTKHLVKKVLPFAKIRVIHPPCTRYLAGEDSDVLKHSIFSVGRLEQRKGFQFVIKAVGLLSVEYPDIHYYLAGDGSYKKELERIVKLYHLEEHITFLGRIDDEKKVSFYKKCEIFAMPSIELEDDYSVEGFGIVYIEANQFGKYVIAGDSGGIRDAVKNGFTGVLIHNVTAENVAMVIKEVFNHYEAYYSTEIIDMRKQWAEEHYIDKIVNKYYHAMAEEGLR